ncbi:hypothetical protein MCOR02_001653 [Pyricularia oryzae]|nr:hypothetical protein MCOR02_001653 [Pyricularia oryzae]KAI6268069.1 hypothetical protein MCOR26_009401 [Pyricularia oryzae]KAI6335616.1 hypothetical protein MCOR28_009614 [Pyricularia oryzae]KAI6419620.1 hypothetical protein MCOR21_010210 [Pyricularia oryzae]KAI6437101.1 hypothetical protein MCOR22_009033 [Pyricularia oryzae]
MVVGIRPKKQNNQRIGLLGLGESFVQSLFTHPPVISDFMLTRASQYSNAPVRPIHFTPWASSPSEKKPIVNSVFNLGSTCPLRYRPLVVTTWHDGSPDTPKGARTARYMPRHPTKIEVDAFTSVAAHLFQSSGPPSVAVNHLLGRQDRICSGAQKLLHTLSWEQQGEAWQGKAQAQAQAMRTWQAGQDPAVSDTVLDPAGEKIIQSGMFMSGLQPVAQDRLHIVAKVASHPLIVCNAGVHVTQRAPLHTRNFTLARLEKDDCDESANDNGRLPPRTVDLISSHRLSASVSEVVSAAATEVEASPSSSPHQHQHQHQQHPQQHSAARYVLQPPFRTRAANSSGRPPLPLYQLTASRLWNPTNSTPRELESRPHRPSTPPPPAVPLSHPVLHAIAPTDPADPVSTSAGEHPLLTLPELRQTRHSTSTRASLQIDKAGSDPRVSLPGSLRHSYDSKGAASSFNTGAQADPGSPTINQEETWEQGQPPLSPRRWPTSALASLAPTPEFFSIGTLDKGKGREIMNSPDQGPGRQPPRDGDVERGPDVLLSPDEPRRSMVSGIGSAISSDNSSIMGDPDQPIDAGEEWGPQHPCYPHLNPHVPVDSPEYAKTRIIRIRRDWLLEGDLAPTFSNLYPEILDPAGLSEQEFRRVIEKLNGELIPIFNPYSWRNLFDGFMGVVTGWLWEDIGFTGAKIRLRKLEQWIEKWNADMEKTIGSEDGIIPPMLIPLRQTAYMSLDIRIGDPEIAPAQAPVPETPVALGPGISSEPEAPAPDEGPS